MKEEKKPILQYPAKAIKTVNIHEIVGMDFVVGFSESKGLVVGRSCRNTCFN